MLYVRTMGISMGVKSVIAAAESMKVPTKSNSSIIIISAMKELEILLRKRFCKMSGKFSTVSIHANIIALAIINMVLMLAFAASSISFGMSFTVIPFHASTSIIE